MSIETDPLSNASPEEPAVSTDLRDAESDTVTPPDAQPGGKSESLVESLDSRYGNPARPPEPATPQPATAPDRYAAPWAPGARHPDGGLIAMRLLSRMQTDLALLTGDKRPATYEEVE